MEKGTKLKKIKVLSYVFLTFVFVVGIVLYSNLELSNRASAEILKALTEKQDYSKTEELKVGIENKEGKVICFSSCYPYVIQTKNNSWDTYSYSECDKENITEICISPNQSKAFAIPLNEISLKSSIYRLAIPVCLGCAIGEKFRVDKIIYSNEFEINK
jgi:hypothetical protein